MKGYLREKWGVGGSPHTSPHHNLIKSCVPVVLPHSVVVYRLSLPTVQCSHHVCTGCTATFCGCVRALPPHNTIQLRRVYLLYCNILWLCTGYPSPQYSQAAPCVPVVPPHSVVVYGVSLPTIQSSCDVCTCCTATFCGCVRGIPPHSTVKPHRVYRLYRLILWLCTGYPSPQYNPATSCVPVVLQHSVVVYGLSRPTIQSSYDVCTCCTATFCGCVRDIPSHSTVYPQCVYPLYCHIRWLSTGSPSPQYSLATPCVPVVPPHSVVVYGISLPTVVVYGLSLPTVQSSHTVCTRCTTTLGGCVRALSPHSFLSLQYNPATMCALVLLPHSVVVYAGSISPQYSLATTCVSVVLPHSVVVYGLSLPTIQSSYNALSHHNTIQLQRVYLLYCNILWLCPGSLSPQYNPATMCASVLLLHSVVVYTASISPQYSLATTRALSPHNTIHLQRVYLLYCNILWFCTGFLSTQYNPATMCATILLPHSVVMYAGSISPRYSLATTCVPVVLPHSVVVYGLSFPTIQSSYNVSTCCTATFCGCARALPPHNTIHLQREYLLYCNILWLCTGSLSPQYNPATTCVPVVLQHSMVVHGLSLPTIQSNYVVCTCCTATFCSYVRGIYLLTIQSSHDVSTCCTATFCGCVWALPPHNTIQLQREYLLYCNILYNVSTCCTATFCGCVRALPPHNTIQLQREYLFYCNILWLCTRSPSPQYNPATTYVPFALQHSVVVYRLSRPTIQSTYNVSTCCTSTFCGCAWALPPHNTIHLQRVYLLYCNILWLCTGSPPHTIQSSYVVCTCCTATFFGYVRGIYLLTIQSSHDVSTCCTATFCGCVRALPPHNTIQLQLPVVLQHSVVVYGLSLPQYNPATVSTCCTQHSVVVYGLSLPTIQSSYNVSTCCTATFCGCVRALSPHNTIQLQREYLLYCNILWLCTRSPSPQYNPATTCVPFALQHSVVVYRLSRPTIQSSYNTNHRKPNITNRQTTVNMAFCHRPPASQFSAVFFVEFVVFLEVLSRGVFFFFYKKYEVAPKAPLKPVLIAHTSADRTKISLEIVPKFKCNIKVLQIVTADGVQIVLHQQTRKHARARECRGYYSRSHERVQLAATNRKDRLARRCHSTGLQQPGTARCG
ncbi:hypothetical protein J6590_027430 [Homalodisca vitripennis]|nr:hypothetical protein J6590_027430 [Homalodisca vitripennis]